jgi:hypothetical protein
LLQVPENYLKAIFGSYLGSTFVYNYGIHASGLQFFMLWVIPRLKLKPLSS